MHGAGSSPWGLGRSQGREGSQPLAMVSVDPVPGNASIYLRRPFQGRVAEWLGTALQKLLLRFESARDLDQQVPRIYGAFCF